MILTMLIEMLWIIHFPCYIAFYLHMFCHLFILVFCDVWIVSQHFISWTEVLWTFLGTSPCVLWFLQCAYLEEAYLLVLKYEPEKQVSDLTSIWESAKLFRDGDWWAPSFFFPFFFFPGGCHLQALSLPHYSLLYLTDRSLYSNLSLDFCHCHHTGDTSRSPGTEDK